MSSNRVYDVLIVGAGPVGLATAIALRQRGVNNILVIDQTRSFRQVGQVIDLLPNGLKALKYIDIQAYERVKQTGLEFVRLANNNPGDKKPRKRAWNHKNLQGQMIRSIPLDFEYWFDRYGGGRVSLSWYSLQTALRNLLPPEIVQVNHRCVNVTKDNGYLEVTCVSDEREIVNNPFAHWERQTSEQDKANSTDELKTDGSDSKKLQAKLVVAADGINSTVRQMLYANSDLSQWAKPSYSGVAAIGCLQIENVPDETVQELEDKYFQSDRIITLHDDSKASDGQNLERSRIILIHRPGNTCGYIIHTPLSLDALQNKSSEEIINLAVNVLEKANFPTSVIKLVSLSTSERLFHRPYYIHPADINIPDSKPIWSNGRVVLVGDAAHGMPPFAAQGVNQGFEDAAVIATLITKIINSNALNDDKIIANEFIKYEQIRRPFMSKIQSATMTNHNWSQAKWDDYGDMVYGRDIRQLISKEVNKERRRTKH